MRKFFKSYSPKSLIIILFVVLFANSASAKMRWGAMAGMTVSTFHFKQDLVPVGEVIGGTAGVVGEMIFPGIGVGLDIGLLYDMQGAMVNLGSRPVWQPTYKNEHVILHNLRLPVHLRLKYTRLNGLEDKIAPIIYGGPEFDIQLGHTNASAFQCSGGDLGLTVGLGAEIYRRWQLTAAYTWGMTYVLKTRLLDNFSAQSRQWNIRLTYFF